MCTPTYSAPEVLDIQCEITTAADLWSLGVLLYLMLFGPYPFCQDNQNMWDDTESTGTKVQMMRDEIEKPRDQWSCWKVVSMAGQSDHAWVDLAKELLQVEPDERLGAGPEGFEELQEHGFFGGPAWFDKLLSRQLPPPYQPKGEIYAEENVEPHDRNVCADEPYAGRRVKGLAKPYSEFNGRYDHLQTEHHGRPVYAKETANAYIYFSDEGSKRWLLGPELGVDDKAWFEAVAEKGQEDLKPPCRGWRSIGKKRRPPILTVFGVDPTWLERF